MLEIKNLVKSFGDNKAVDNISFIVENGKMYGLVGRNGAGKSTTFRMILGIIEPTEGSVLYNGKKIDSKVSDKIGYLPEEGSLIPEYTVLELCEYYGALKLMKSSEVREKIIYWLEEFNVLEFLNKKVKDLSKGNKQKIQFIVSVLHNPDLIILDEPFSGLDPISVEEIKRAVVKLRNEGKTIIFSSHRMDHVAELCESVIIMDKGKTILQGNIKELEESYEINGTKGHDLNEIFIDKVGSLYE
ncbi:MAG: ATP-binding cassette domain-containing protein [Clostridia bacterium]|nr:ATP-binding cassette domain-containing protein [Clostridia bacterium]